MTSQTITFLQGEGDAWFARNRDQLGARDPVSDALDQLDFIKPTAALEIGCANGWRLKKLEKRYRCTVRGIDISRAAIEAREVPTIQIGWADALPYLTNSFDLVIFGFCLYLTDPSEWLRIAAEADRVLKHEGYLVIHDFRNHGIEFAIPYKHHADVLSYHVNFAGMWLAHPWYGIVTHREAGHDETVTVLRKNANNIKVRA